MRELEYRIPRLHSPVVSWKSPEMLGDLYKTRHILYTPMEIYTYYRHTINTIYTHLHILYTYYTHTIHTIHTNIGDLYAQSCTVCGTTSAMGTKTQRTLHRDCWVLPTEGMLQYFATVCNILPQFAIFCHMWPYVVKCCPHATAKVHITPGLHNKIPA